MLMLTEGYLNFTYISFMFLRRILSVVVLFITLTALSHAKVVHVQYYDNGNVKIEVIKMKKGLNQIKQYYRDGSLFETGYSKNGLYQGKWERYNRTGEVVATAYYHNNVKIGSWNHVNQWTRSTFHVYYNNGLPVSYREYDQSGQLIASGTRVP